MIGTARTPFETTEEAPRQGFLEGAIGEIEVEPRFESGLEGLHAGDRVDVIWYADRAKRTLLRLDRRGNRGVFASRSPARPTPLGITRCTILSVDRHRLRVEGVDMVDGTPVLDVKIAIDPDRVDTRP